MRTTAVNATALALLLAGASLGLGQQAPPDPLLTKRPAEEKAPPAKSKLEEMLAQALKDNPDIRVAAAKLSEAEAELNRVRLQVMQKVVTLYHGIDMARTDVQSAEKVLRRVRGLGGVVPSAELESAEAALAAAKAKLAAVEAEVPYVTGKQPHSTAEGAATQLGLRYLSGLPVQGRLFEFTYAKAGVEAAPRPVQGPLAERIRKALDEPVSLRVSEGSVADVLRLLREKEPALNIKYVPRAGAGPKLTIELKDVPLGAALEYLEDSLPDYTIVMREYGLLLTVADRAPPGAVSLHDFWKGGRGEAAVNNPPAKEVEGVVKKVSATGLVAISIGSDAGLAKGNTLEVFRLTPAPKYLGKIQVIAVQPTEAICRPVGRLDDVTQAGDRVASRLPKK